MRYERSGEIHHDSAGEMGYELAVPRSIVERDKSAGTSKCRRSMRQFMPWRHKQARESVDLGTACYKRGSIHNSLDNLKTATKACFEPMTAQHLHGQKPTFPLTELIRGLMRFFSRHCAIL